MTRAREITAVILAGGLGTRLRQITQDRCPKPMVPVAVGTQSVPFLEFVVSHLSQQGVSDFVFCIGHLGDQIVDHFSDGAQFGLSFRYDYAGEVDTGSRVQSAMRLVQGTETLVACGDVFLPLELGCFLSHFDARPDWQVMLAAVDAVAPLEPNVAFDADGTVTAHGRIDPTGRQTGLEAGTLAVRRSAFETIGTSDSFSLIHDLFPKLIRRKLLGGAIVTSEFFDIGTPAGYHRFCDFAADGGARPLSRLSAPGLKNET